MTEKHQWVYKIADKEEAQKYLGTAIEPYPLEKKRTTSETLAKLRERYKSTPKEQLISEWEQLGIETEGRASGSDHIE